MCAGQNISNVYLTNLFPLSHVTEADCQDRQHSNTSRPEVLLPPIMAAKVGVILKSLRSCHAPGICSITAEQLKHGGKIMVNGQYPWLLITEVSCCCWSLAKYPLVSYWTECFDLWGLPTNQSRPALCKQVNHPANLGAVAVHWEARRIP